MTGARPCGTDRAPPADTGDTGDTGHRARPGSSEDASVAGDQRKAYSYLPLEYRKGQRLNWVVDKPMGKVVTALAVVGGSQGGSLYHYAGYCRQV